MKVIQRKIYSLEDLSNTVQRQSQARGHGGEGHDEGEGDLDEGDLGDDSEGNPKFGGRSVQGCEADKQTNTQTHIYTAL